MQSSGVYLSSLCLETHDLPNARNAAECIEDSVEVIAAPHLDDEIDQPRPVSQGFGLDPLNVGILRSNR